MKKILLILIVLTCLTGCSKNVEVKTIIKQDNSYVSINYPVTNETNLDREIKKHVDNTYNSFKNTYTNYQTPEFNISYDYNLLNDEFISIHLNTFKNNGINNSNSVTTFNYNIKNHDFLNIDDIVNSQKLKYEVKKEIKKNYKMCTKTCLKNLKINSYFLDEDYITVFFKSKDLNIKDTKIISIKIKNEDLGLTLKKKDKTKKIEIKKSKVTYNDKVVALTFDDGPSKYTDKILKILEKKGARATFFVVGNKVELYNETLLKMVSNGNEIGNHSFDHKLLTRLTDEEFKQDIKKTQEIIFETTGFIPKLIRPTYGGYNDKLMSNVDLKLTLWDVDASDWKYKSERRIVNNVIKNVSNGDIILMHDIFSRTVNSAEKIIDILQKEGYSFVTVSELNKIKEKRNL